MHDGLRRAIKAAITVPIGGAVGYAFCHDPSLQVLFAIHGMLLAPLALVSAGTARWGVLLLTFAAVYGLVAAGLDVWAAFLIIAGIYLLIALILAAIAAAFFKKMKGPEQAKAEAQETVDTLKGSLSAGAAAAHGEPVLPTPEAATQASA